MTIDWPARWERKAERMNAPDMDWNRFRRDPILMEGIQTQPGRFSVFYSRCSMYGVPMWLMADNPAVGDPVGRWANGTFLTAGSMKHASHTWRIVNHWRAHDRGGIRVLEIGGGYGGLVAALLRGIDIDSYTIIDAEPMHRIQREYVSRWLETRNTVEPFHMIHLSPADAERVGRIDLAISSHTLVEMPAEAVAQYMDLLHRCLVPGGAFYTVNNVRREVKPDEFPFDDRWEYSLNGPAFGSEMYSEILAVRKPGG